MHCTVRSHCMIAFWCQTLWMMKAFRAQITFYILDTSDTVRDRNDESGKWKSLEWNHPLCSTFYFTRMLSVATQFSLALQQVHYFHHINSTHPTPNCKEHIWCQKLVPTIMPSLCQNSSCLCKAHTYRNLRPLKFHYYLADIPEPVHHTGSTISLPNISNCFDYRAKNTGLL